MELGIQMQRLLDFFGSPFVYRSPKPYQGFARFLEDLPSKQLRGLAETAAHCSKKKLVQIYLQKNAISEIQTE